MSRQKGTLSLASNIEPSMNAPLDARTVVNLKADLTAANSFPYFYQGIVVACKEDHKLYQLIGNDPTDITNWEKVGGAGSSTDDELSDTSENPVQNKVIKNALDTKVDETVVGDLSDLQTTDKTDLVSAINEAAQAENQVISLADFEQLTPLEKNNGKAYFIQDAYAEDRYIAYTGFTPVGTVISYYGETAPAHYLVCDGSVYNKADYPELWTHLSSFSDTTPYTVDGDNTKFKVPDLRGEFLRGTGTNGHVNQGSGAAVGVHQDGTVVDLPISYNNGTIGVLSSNVGKGFYNNSSQLNLDSISTSSGHMLAISANKYGPYNDLSSYTSRPTNTSVLYCIAYHNIYIDARHNYSLEEQEVGIWIDGKTLYQKTFSNVAMGTTLLTGVETLVEAKVINIKGVDVVVDQGVSNGNAIDFMFSNGSVSVSAFYGSGYTYENVDYITLRYTKTTD